MPRKLSDVSAVAACFLLAATVAAEPAPTAPVHKKRHVTRHWHVRLLLGYRPSEVIERERAVHYYRLCGPQYYGLAELLSRALEWRWLRPLLDADADWSDVELRPLIDAGSCRRSALRRPGGHETDEDRPAHSPIKGPNRLISLTVIRFLLLRAGAA